MPPFTVTSPQSLGDRVNYPSMKQIGLYQPIRDEKIFFVLSKQQFLVEDCFPKSLYAKKKLSEMT